MATGLNFSDSYRELQYIGALSILDAVAERIVDGIFNYFVHVDIRATGHTN